MAASSATSLRYYLWANDGPWRITHQLHSDLVSGQITLRQYAGTKQEIVEVFIRKVRGRPMIVEARGGVYSFDARGGLDVSSQVEAAAIAVDKAKARAVQDKVFDIGPALRQRRYTRRRCYDGKRISIRPTQSPWKKFDRKVVAAGRLGDHAEQIEGVDLRWLARENSLANGISWRELAMLVVRPRRGEKFIAVHGVGFAAGGRSNGTGFAAFESGPPLFPVHVRSIATLKRTFKNI